MIKRIFPNGMSSLGGFICMVLVMLLLNFAAGTFSVRAEKISNDQLLVLQQQEDTARLAREEALRAQALEARREAFRNAGTLLDVSAIPESILAKAEKIAAETPLDLRSALAVAVYAKQFDLKPALLVAVICKESNFRANTVGSHRDRGYMQIIPATERFMAKYFGPWIGVNYNPKRIFEPEYNIGLGAAYLGDMLWRYGDIHHVLTEYNRGEGKTKLFFNRNNSYSSSYSQAVLALEQNFAGLND